MKLILLILFCASVCDCYKILVIFSYASPSHSILGDAYVKRLLEDGHEVTYITTKPIKSTSKNLKQIDIGYLKYIENSGIYELEKILSKKVDLQSLELNFGVMHNVDAGAVNSAEVQALLNDLNVEFDLVIGEWLYSELKVGLASVFNCPLIWASSMEPGPLTLRLIDELPNPAYTSDFHIGEPAPFSFGGRLRQLWRTVNTLIYRKIYLENSEEAAYKKAFELAAVKRGVELIPFSEMKYKASLMFGNSHVSLGQSIHLPQNYKAIAGYHIKDKADTLPQDLQSIMDNSTNGVIYFSMGTILKEAYLPNYMKMALIKMFGELNYTVIWKMDKKLPELPENLHVVHWAPQQSILAHPKTKLFITHGGILSISETVHYAVPFIGIPGFADQELNTNTAAARGCALKVDLDFQLVENLKKAINTMINDNSFNENIKKLSFIYHYRQVRPIDEISFWVRHVIETNGAYHLTSPALKVQWYQKLYLDLVVLVFLVLVFLVQILKKMMKKIVCRAKTKVE